jgi:hypothetical protein
MPQAFDRCVRNGGHVITKKLEGNKYMHICYIRGKSFAGEVKQKQSAVADAIERKK